MAPTKLSPKSAPKVVDSDSFFYFLTHIDAIVWINKKIGTLSSGRRIRFPPNSPDLSPLDYSVWKRLQDGVDKEKCKTLLDLRVALKKHGDLLMSDTDYSKKKNTKTG